MECDYIMAISKQVKDGYLGDLPEAIQLKVMNIHKQLLSVCKEVWEDKAYDPIRNEDWAKSAIDEFCAQPTNGTQIGSVRVYKQGKRFSCMIQLTGHVMNHRNDINHELLHDFFRHVHQDLKVKVRKQFDMKLTCESEHGEPFEGFDVWTSSKMAAVIWELFEDQKIKRIKPMKESADSEVTYERMFAELYELPVGAQDVINNTMNGVMESIQTKLQESSAQLAADFLAGNYNRADKIVCLRKQNGIIHGDVDIVECDIDNFHKESTKVMMENIIDDPTKRLYVSENGSTYTFTVALDSFYAEKVWEWLEKTEAKEEKDIEPKKKEDEIKESTDIVFDPFLEANNEKPEYNTDMSEAEAKRTLRSLSQGIITGIAEKKDYKVTQYTANIYANIISKNLLPLWAKGFRKMTITLDSYQSFFTFEFKVPKMTQDFVSRFIQGRETINGLIRRHPEINIRMSPRIFHTMKNPDDAYNFFKAAIKYYDSGLTKYSDKLMVEAMKLNHEMKHLISTTKLSGIITCPMQLLFIFDDVKMDNKDTFKISQEDIKTVNQFIRNIYTRYAAPEKEKKQIVEDIDKMVKALRESCDPMNENVIQLQYLSDAVNNYFFGGFENILEAHNEEFAESHIDRDWLHRQKNPEVKYLQEKWGVKKLKKIPADLVAYITIETEAIRDANDKMMISSYCLGKIEIVEWYIELLEVGSKKYIVPHSKPYLESLRTQLLACFKKIMEVKIVNPNDRPIIDIKYPKGYEG